VNTAYALRMCGRYAAAKDPGALVEEFEVDETVVASPLPPDYNVAPTNLVYAILNHRPKDATEGAPTARQLRVVRWGLVPSWAKDPAIGSRMINARMETVAEKPSFKRAFAARRCLLPADGYYEWYAPLSQPSSDPDRPAPSRSKAGKPLKQPFFIHRRDGRSLAMAGLYEWWHDKTRERDDPEAWLLSATIITTASTDALGRIHDRMPLVVDRADWASWLDPEVSLASDLERLMVPAGDGELDAYPVARRVNSVRNNGPELIEPLPAEDVVPGIDP